MILANINIGSGTGINDGESLYSAFNKVNQNFANVQSNVNSLSNSVTTVAGRTGNVVLTINDIVGYTAYVTQANLNTANTAMKSYVDTKITANISALVNSAPTVLDTIRELADAIGDDPNFAVNIALSVSSANTAMKGYVDGQISAVNSAVTLANTIQSAQVGAANLAITAANVGMKGYVDQANTIQSAQVGAANLAIIAANLGMKGYVDSVASQSIFGNGNVKSYLTQFDGNIIPSANVTYSLGNATHQWRDLWVSNNTIYIGGTPLTVSGTGSLLINGTNITANNTSTATTASISGGNVTLNFNYGWTTVTLTESITNINFTNVPPAGTVSAMTVEFVQDSAGGHTVSGSTYLTAGGAGLDISTTSNATSIASFVTSNGGTKIFGISAGKNWV